MCRLVGSCLNGCAHKSSTDALTAARIGYDEAIDARRFGIPQFGYDVADKVAFAAILVNRRADCPLSLNKCTPVVLVPGKISSRNATTSE